MHTYTRNSVVAVQPFTRQSDGDEVIIGLADRGVFLAVPPDAVEVLENLAEGRSVGEATDLYQQKYGEALDLTDFLALLESKGIVQPTETGEEAIEAHKAAPVMVRKVRYHFSSLPQQLAQRIFSAPVLAAASSLVILAIAALIQNPSLAPRTRDLFFPTHRTLNWTILTVATYATLFLHELAHLIAARAVGVNSRMGIGHRLWFLVAETDLTGLWSIPKEKRYLPLVAGIVADAASVALLVLWLAAASRHWLSLSPFVVGLARGMVVLTLMRIAWQCFFFLRTDLYYVIANLFGCRNLLKDTEVFLRNQLSRIFPRLGRVDQSAIPASEFRVVWFYSVLWIVGRIAALLMLFLVTLPVAFQYIQSVASAFKMGYSSSPSNFLDSLLLATYALLPLIIGLTMWIGSLLRRERTAK